MDTDRVLRIALLAGEILMLLDFIAKRIKNIQSRRYGKNNLQKLWS